MSKKLAVGARKAGMKGKQSASKRELIEAGNDTASSRSVSVPPRKRTKKATSS